MPPFSTFVAADYFQPPPPSNYQPRTWERIAVPPVIFSSHARAPIYKRVPGKSVDIKYNVVTAELDSQGFDQRKRVKMTTYKSIWGLHNFNPKHESAMDIQNEIVKARGKFYPWMILSALQDTQCVSNNWTRPGEDCIQADRQGQRDHPQQHAPYQAIQIRPIPIGQDTPKATQ